MSAPSSYDGQHRGTFGAYEAYFAGMDRLRDYGDSALNS